VRLLGLLSCKLQPPTIAAFQREVKKKNERKKVHYAINDFKQKTHMVEKMNKEFFFFVNKIKLLEGNRKYFDLFLFVLFIDIWFAYKITNERNIFRR